MNDSLKSGYTPQAIVVNDDTLQLKLLAGLLTKGGFQTISFSNAADALSYMHTNGAPDLIVTDLYMPELDGWRFCRLLRSPEYKALNKIPILVVSATFSGETTNRITSELGANAFLSAPVDGKKFIQTANALIQGQYFAHNPYLLIAIKDSAFADKLEDILSVNGYEPLSVASSEDVKSIFEKNTVDILVIEDDLLNNSDPSFFSKLKKHNPDCINILIADAPNPQLALSWMQNGVFQYLHTPVSPEYLVEICAQARREKALLRVEDLLDKRTHDALEQERQMQSIYNAAPIGIGIVANRTIIDINDKFCQMIGYSREELLGHNSRILYPSDEEYEAVGREKYKQIENSRTATGTVETVFQRKDGSIMNILLSSTVIDKENISHGVTFTALDITNIKNTENNLRESKQLLRDILDTVPVRVFWKDKNSCYLGCNRPFAHDAGLKKPEDLIGKTDHDLGWHAQATLYRADDLQVIETGVAKLGYEEPQTTPDGSTIWLRTSKVPLHDAEEKIIGVLGTYEDITEQKHAEEERESLQAQLIQAQKMESIGRLAGGVAHDFNNMLAVIVGQTELALEQIPPDSQLYDDIGEIEIAARRSIELTKQLLAFARKETITPRVLNINEAISNMLKMLQRLIGENIELKWEPGKDLWHIMMDPSQLDQIIANLAVNARDAIEKTGELIIQTNNILIQGREQEDLLEIPEGEYVQITVQDTGSGIAQSTLKHIFEPFFTTKELGQGTGLGLSTVYGAVKQNSGYIFVNSKLDKGTIFTIYLPHTKEEAPHTVTVKAAPQKARGEMVLIVEDELSILHLTQRALEKYGYNTLIASSSREALEIAQNHKGTIDLLFTDVVMPGMNGPTLYENIKLIRPEINALFMSGYTADTLVVHGVNNKNPNFLQKPFPIKVLIEKVREQLDQ